MVMSPESEKSIRNNHTCLSHEPQGPGYVETASHKAQQKRLMNITKTDQAEEDLFEKIYDASDTLDLLQMRDDDVKKVVNFITEVSPSMKEKFDCLVNKDVTRLAVENLAINIFRKGQRLFRKGERSDRAYLILYGDLNFYNTDFFLATEGDQHNYEKGMNNLRMIKRQAKTKHKSGKAISKGKTAHMGSVDSHKSKNANINIKSMTGDSFDRGFEIKKARKTQIVKDVSAESMQDPLLHCSRDSNSKHSR